MHFQEKSALANLLVDLLLFFGYGSWLLIQLTKVSPEELDYKWVVLFAILASVVATIASQIALAVFDYKNAKEDVMDRAIRGKANAFTLGFLVVPYFFGLALALFEAPYFQIVHLMFFGGTLASIVTSIARIWYYRRGI